MSVLRDGFQYTLGGVWSEQRAIAVSLVEDAARYTEFLVDFEGVAVEFD